MKRALLLLATFALFSSTGCQRRGDVVQPRNYDALALETGHWEWESTTYQTGQRTPATEGFTRQLVFSSDGSILIQHDGLLNKKRPYALSMGPSPSYHSSPMAVPIITYETDSDLPNNARKTYTIAKSPTGQHLIIIGEAHETYRWVKE